MLRSKSNRPYNRSVDLTGVILNGDYVIKASHIVRQSRKGGNGTRYHSVEDFLERSFEDAVVAYEEKHGEIEIAPSGLSVISSTSENE